MFFFPWKTSSTRSKANLKLGVKELLFVGMFVIICFGLLKVLFVAASLCFELILGLLYFLLASLIVTTGLQLLSIST